MPLDDREDVVEVVGHTGGEPTDGFELHALAGLLFGFALAGHVVELKQHMRMPVQLHELPREENAALAIVTRGEVAFAFDHVVGSGK